jgi:predicted dinucleotide-binding enzyme
LKEGKPKGTAGRIALPVAGDDPKAKSVVIRLIDEIGFDGVDAGPLEESWRQQPDTPVYGSNLGADRLIQALQQASPERKPKWRATPNSPGDFEHPA